MSVELSVIMPMYFEENCIANSVARVTKVCAEMGVDYEILLVDDGSTDDTIEIVRSLADDDPHIRMVVLASNHGKNLAITAGISHASGRYILTMDPDLRDSPEEIERFYNEIKRGYDIVFSLRKSRKDSLRDSVLSEWFWSLFQKYSGLAIPKNLGVIRIFRDDFASEFLRYSETFRFNEGIFFRIGMRRGFLEVIQTEGDEQPSKFTFAKKLQLAFMAITSHSNQPLTLPWYAAGFTFVLGYWLSLHAFSQHDSVWKFDLLKG